MSEPFHYVTLSSSAGHSVQILLGQQGAALTGGSGGWETVSRPKRTAITRWAGKDPYAMDIPVIFDGVRGNVNQEAHIQTLVKMGEPVGTLKQPPTLRCRGAVPFGTENIWWVISGIQWDNADVLWRHFGKVIGRVRQPAVISLMEYVDEQVIVTQASPAVAAGGGNAGTKVKQGSGKNVKQEAQDEYGDPSLAQKILDANPWLPIDKRLGIPIGTSFVVPALKSK